MKLTFEQMKACLKGAVTIRENADGTVLVRRMKDDQIAPYAIHDPSRHYACNNSCSIQLDFYTDATTLTVTSVGRRKKKRPDITMDVLENGVLKQSVSCREYYEPSPEPVEVPQRVFHFALSEGEKRVTLYLPRTYTVDGMTVEISDGATFRPYTHSKTMIAFGDSVTFGTNAAHPSCSWVNRLGRMLDAQVYNYGIGGERFQEWKITGEYPKCDFITVSYGSNDFGHKISSDEQFSYKMPAFLKTISERFSDIPIFVMLPMWRGDEEVLYTDIGVLQVVRDRVAAECTKYPNLHVVDGQGFVPHDRMLFADNLLHPNDEGMEYYANVVYEAIKDKV